MAVEPIPPFPHTGPPDQYQAPNGVEVAAGLPDDAGSRDPSSTSVGGSVSNAMAQQAEIASDLYGMGGHVGDLINLPDRNY